MGLERTSQILRVSGLLMLGWGSCFCRRHVRGRNVGFRLQ